MKINPVSNPNILRSYQAAKHVSRMVPTGGKLDEVSFSEEAITFSRVMAEMKEEMRPEVRSQEEKSRIEEIASRVRNGTYKVESAAVAEKILDSVRFR